MPIIRIPFIVLLLCLVGCIHYEEVSFASATEKESSFDFGKINNHKKTLIRYQYELSLGKKEYIYQGIIHIKENGAITVAGMSDTGVTLFVAEINENKCEIVKNNLGLPDSLISYGLVPDAFLFLIRTKVHLKSFDFPKDNSVWRVIFPVIDYGEGVVAYFVKTAQKQYCCLLDNNSKIYQADLVLDKNDMVIDANVHHYIRNYKAKIYLIKEMSQNEKRHNL